MCARYAAASTQSERRRVQQNIRAATFEVVQLKPPDAYDDALPRDLIPYQQRTDKYRSIGTAFAIGSNRYGATGFAPLREEGR